MGGAVVTEFVWNDAALRTAPAKAMALAAQDVRATAIAKCEWNHVRRTIVVVGGRNAYGLTARSKDANFLEHGTGPHEEAPRRRKALKMRDGRFASHAPHPGTEAKPFLAPAAATLPVAFNVRAREVFPKPAL